MTSLDSSPLPEGFPQWMSDSNCQLLDHDVSRFFLFWRGPRDGCQIQICQVTDHDVPRFFTSFGGVPAMDVRFKFVRISDFGMFFLLCFVVYVLFIPFTQAFFQAFFQASFRHSSKRSHKQSFKQFIYSFCDKMFFGLFTLF